MQAPDKIEQSNEAAAPAYAAYAQLVKMLLPSSGSLAIYAPDGDLAWCSDGFEQPDFRSLIDEIRGRSEGLQANLGALRRTTAGASALLAKLGDEQGAVLGYVLIELGQTHSGAGNSMAASLTRPLIACLAAHMALERPIVVTREPSPNTSDPRMEFLLGIGEIDLNSPRAIRHLLQRCVDRLDCLSAVFCIPDLDLTELAERAALTDSATRARLDSTRKHLLVWAQLNNRTMLVNRIDSAQMPYKILSCPVVSRDGKVNGLLALFRASERPNFELDDVRLIEFTSRQAMALLYERQDGLTGLMSRAAFERHLDETLGASSRLPAGTLVYFDVEQLKAINAQFGLAIGDEVILRTAQLIRRSLTPSETACRLAGDRFIVHLAERDSDGAATLAVEIARSARDLGYTVQGRKVPLALRFGVAESPSATTGARHWIAAAELACQAARTDRQPGPYNAP